MYQEVCE